MAQNKFNEKARYRPIEALRAVRALIADKEDTSQVFRVINALGGPALEKLYNRFSTLPGAIELVERERTLVDTLMDRTALGAMPEGSLGRIYLDFMISEQLTADGLVSASDDVRERLGELDPHFRTFAERLRDSHDLWHVITNYGRDGHGEICLLAFMYAQTRNPGILLIVAAGVLKFRKSHPHIDAVKLAREGYRLGREATMLAAADWEALLALPIAEARRRLKVGRPEAYLASGAYLSETPGAAMPAFAAA